MNVLRSNATPIRSARHGFTVLELLLSVSLMTVIVIALYTVFDQTQKALRSTMTQVDVLESMRSTTDLLKRDLEAATPVAIAATNDASMAVAVNPMSDTVNLKGLDTSAGGRVLLQTTIQDIYFATRQNDFWTAVGYWVGPMASNSVGVQRISVGRLYRFSYETTAANFRFTNLFSRFNSGFRLSSSAPVMDGVIHLRLVAFDRNSRPMVFDAGIPDRSIPPQNNSAMFVDLLRNTETAYWFRRDTFPDFPTALDLEIGILEPQAATRYASIPDAKAAHDYLARNTGRIHLFRQRIPLRNSPTR